MMKFKSFKLVCLVVATPFLSGCDREKPAQGGEQGRPSTSAPAAGKAYPVGFFSVRDGDITGVFIRGQNNDEPAVYLEEEALAGVTKYVAYRKGENEGADVISMTRQEVLDLFERVEGLLRDYFGEEQFESIRSNTRRYTGLTGEEALVHIDEQEFLNRMDASFVLEMIAGFRKSSASPPSATDSQIHDKNDK